MKRLIAALTFLLISVTPAWSAPSNSAPWTRYFGSSYIAPVWGNTMRGLGRGKIGLTRQFDEQIESDLQTFAKTHDVIAEVSLPVDQKFGQSYAGSESAKMKKWRDNLTRDARKIINSPFNAGTVYWQVGNEINIRHFGRRLGAWTGKGSVNKHNDISIIPSLVENYIAPAVETLRSLSGDRQRNPIILGSMAAYFRAGSMEFLDSLLNYRVKGDHAESLRGKQVFEIIDIAAIHYLVTSGDGSLLRASNDPYAEVLDLDRSQGGDIWFQALDSLYDKWLATGKLHGIWATEEIGKSQANAGLGAASAIKVTARYLHWWTSHAITPEQGRSIFWGTTMGAPGTTAMEGMQTLYDFLGDSAIQQLDGAVGGSSSGNFESYVFQPVSNPSRRVAVLFAKSSSQDQGFAREMTIKAQSWQGNVQATIHLFSANGHEVMPVAVTREQDDLKIVFPAAHTRKNQGVAVIFLSREAP